MSASNCLSRGPPWTSSGSRAGGGPSFGWGRGCASSGTGLSVSFIVVTSTPRVAVPAGLRPAAKHLLAGRRPDLANADVAELNLTFDSLRRRVALQTDVALQRFVFNRRDGRLVDIEHFLSVHGDP